VSCAGRILGIGPATFHEVLKNVQQVKYERIRLIIKQNEAEEEQLRKKRRFQDDEAEDCGIPGQTTRCYNSEYHNLKRKKKIFSNNYVIPCVFIC
jgi:hypothetical protein